MNNRLLTSTKAVLEKAEQIRKEGDEENAYILYMKYFNLISICQNQKDLKAHTNLLREFLGTNKDIHARMDVLDKLKSSLIKR